MTLTWWQLLAAVRRGADRRADNEPPPPRPNQAFADFSGETEASSRARQLWQCEKGGYDIASSLLSRWSSEPSASSAANTP